MLDSKDYTRAQASLVLPAKWMPLPPDTSMVRVRGWKHMLSQVSLHNVLRHTIRCCSPRRNGCEDLTLQSNCFSILAAPGPGIIIRAPEKGCGPLCCAASSLQENQITTDRTQIPWPAHPLHLNIVHLAHILAVESIAFRDVALIEKPLDSPVRRLRDTRMER